MNEILIENCQDKVEVTEEFAHWLTNAVDEALKLEGIQKSCEVSILLTDNEEIHALNLKYREKDRPTDVLSFPMLLREEIDAEIPPVMIGDIVISVETAVAQADLYGHSLAREISFLTAHSVLHLLGYDHETAEEEKVMIEKQKKVLLNLGLIDSICD